MRRAARLGARQVLNGLPVIVAGDFPVARGCPDPPARDHIRLGHRLLLSPASAEAGSADRTRLRTCAKASSSHKGRLRSVRRRRRPRSAASSQPTDGSSGSATLAVASSSRSRGSVSSSRSAYSLIEHAPPPRPRASQAHGGRPAPAAALTIAARRRGLGRHDLALPAAHQTRDDVGRGDGPPPCPRAPRTSLGRATDLLPAHLPPPFDGRGEADGPHPRLGPERRARAGQVGRPGGRLSLELLVGTGAGIRGLRSGRVRKTADGTRSRAACANPDVESCIF